VTDAPVATFDYVAPDLLPLVVPLDTLTEAPDNARKHSLSRDIPALTESLRRFGQRKPIVAKRNYRGLSNVVVAGTGTLIAARRLAWSHIAVAWFEGSDTEACAYAISDNRVAELSAWNVNQLVALQADGDVDLLQLWGDDADLAALLRDGVPTPTFAEVPETEQARLDRFEPVVCPHCGGEIRRKDLR
jgi:ParB-like chromosome segregation protein Spo0J